MLRIIGTLPLVVFLLFIGSVILEWRDPYDRPWPICLAGALAMTLLSLLTVFVVVACLSGLGA